MAAELDQLGLKAKLIEDGWEIADKSTFADLSASKNMINVDVSDQNDTVNGYPNGRVNIRGFGGGVSSTVRSAKADDLDAIVAKMNAVIVTTTVQADREAARRAADKTAIDNRQRRTEKILRDAGIPVGPLTGSMARATVDVPFEGAEVRITVEAASTETAILTIAGLTDEQATLILQIIVG